MKPMAAVAAFILLVASGAQAQDAIRRPAPSSHRPPSSSSTEPRGPFDARPGTYAPHYNSNSPSHLHHRSGLGYALPFVDPAVGVGTDDAPADDAATSAATADQDDARPGRSEPPNVAAPAAPPAAPQAQTSHVPDTFYVIPGCYAGNRPPAPERLPKGCLLAKLRTTPVR